MAQELPDEQCRLAGIVSVPCLERHSLQDGFENGPQWPQALKPVNLDEILRITFCLYQSAISGGQNHPEQASI
jgi:hypothetical protein